MATMAFDGSLGKLVMFGGSSEAGNLNDTWAWDGKGWTAIHPSTIPVAQNASMTYDPQAKHLVVVGSDQSVQPQRNLVWIFRDGDWTTGYVWNTPDCAKACTGTAQPFSNGALTYDDRLGKIIMLAGGPPGPGQQTWAWNGANWSLISTSHRPLALSCCPPVYDSATGQVLSMGYAGLGYGGINRTWIFDGNDWLLSPAFTPDGIDVQIVDDPQNAGVLLLVGGRPGLTGTETWLWDGKAWHRVDTAGPPDLNGISLGYDAAQHQVVMFGGRDGSGHLSADTWIWDGQHWQELSATP